MDGRKDGTLDDAVEPVKSEAQAEYDGDPELRALPDVATAQRLSARLRTSGICSR